MKRKNLVSMSARSKDVSNCCSNQQEFANKVENKRPCGKTYCAVCVLFYLLSLSLCSVFGWT